MTMLQNQRYPNVYLFRRIVYAKVFIDTHFAEKIDLTHIAAQAFISKYHFIRLFNALYKKTPYQYLSFVRIEKAKQLLLTNMTASQVCYAVGFESVSSFTGLFRRRVGQTPSAYQAACHLKISAVAQMPLKFIPGCFVHQNGWQSALAGNAPVLMVND